MPVSTIVGPGGDPTAQYFQNARNMFGGTPSGGGTGQFGLQPQPVAAGDNDLTRAQRAGMNLLGGYGGQLVGGGQSLIPAGLDITQTGLGASLMGLGTTGTGLATLQPSIDFYTKLLSGDPTTMTQALSPTASNIAAITSGATDLASRGMPQGGARASTLANLPFAQASQVGNAALGLQPAAAQALAALGGEQAQIGGEQAQIGQGIAGTGLGVGGLGTTLTGQGLSSLQAYIGDILQKMGINLQDSPLNTFLGVTQGIANLGKAASGFGGAFSGGTRG
jgi:hypothetical protein